MADPGQLRVSDADRERVADELREHFAAGRITPDELSERLEAVYAAKTSGQLADQRMDLPDLHPQPVTPGMPPARTRREVARRRIYQDAGRVVLINVLCVAIWFATGADGSFWPIWVMLVSAFRLAQDAWRLLGPAAELEAERRERRREQRRLRHEERRELRP
jgi:hypothetical protein